MVTSGDAEVDKKHGLVVMAKTDEENKYTYGKCVCGEPVGGAISEDELKQLFDVHVATEKLKRHWG